VPRPSGQLTKEEVKARKEAERLRRWEHARSWDRGELGAAIPPGLADRLRSDGAIWCHHTLWCSRLYLDCINGRAGSQFPYTDAASVIAKLHDGRPARP
jgi:hypothetical protein